jgi:hypothetical protein
VADQTPEELAQRAAAAAQGDPVAQQVLDQAATGRDAEAPPHAGHGGIDPYADAPPAVPCRMCGETSWDRAGDGWVCTRCHPTPQSRRQEVAAVTERLRAAVAQHGVHTKVAGDGHEVGGSEVAWMNFIEHGLFERKVAVLRQLEQRTDAREPGEKG